MMRGVGSSSQSLGVLKGKDQEGVSCRTTAVYLLATRKLNHEEWLSSFLRTVASFTTGTLMHISMFTHPHHNPRATTDTQPSSPPEGAPVPVIISLVSGFVLVVVIFVCLGVWMGCRKRSIAGQSIVDDDIDEIRMVLTHRTFAEASQENERLPIYSLPLPTGDQSVLGSARIAPPPPVYLPPLLPINQAAPTRWIPPVFPLTSVVRSAPVDSRHQSIIAATKAPNPISDRL